MTFALSARFNAMESRRRKESPFFRAPFLAESREQFFRGFEASFGRRNAYFSLSS
jgi:hypothetical protein